MLGVATAPPAVMTRFGEQRLLPLAGPNRPGSEADPGVRAAEPVRRQI
jgi:hypothetical protein